MTTASTVRRDILDAARGGALALTIDLNDVTLLASAGVRVLHELAEPLDLTFLAAPECPARAVVELTGLQRRLG